MRRAVALTLSALLAVAVVACGGDDGDAGGSMTTAAAGGAAFPVDIEHKYGTTTIEARPERVVTVGLTDQDSMLALGVVPVGTTEWFGGHPGAVWPWAQDELGDGAVPEVVGDATAINFERIAALRPDLILAVYSGVTDAEYGTLSAIAPTVAQPADAVDYGVAWDEQTLTIGRALGLEAEADAAVESVRARFATARAEHPDFEGATGLVATSDGSTVFVYAPEDVRGRFLTELGFESVPEIADLAGDEFSAEVSLERVDLIDVDVLVWIVGIVDQDRERVRSEPLYATLDVAIEGRDVYVANLSELGGATSFVSVLSLPYLIDGLVPMLAAAVDGDPATPVPEPRAS